MGWEHNHILFIAFLLCFGVLLCDLFLPLPTSHLPSPPALVSPCLSEHVGTCLEGVGCGDGSQTAGAMTLTHNNE